MSMLKALAARLSQLKKAADFEAIIPELEASLSACQAKAVDLGAELEAALFESPEAADAISTQISENAAEQKNLQLALAGAERRRQDAASSEAMAAVEQRMKEATKVQATLRRDYLKLHEHLTAATDLLSEIRRQEGELQTANALAAQHKRNELIVRSPWWHLGNLIGHAGHNEEYPLTGIMIRGYLPRHPDGPALARMKEVRL